MKRQEGTLLIEALVAIFLTGLVVAGLATVLLLVQRTRIVTAERGEAAILAATQLDAWEAGGGPPKTASCTEETVTGVSGLSGPVRYRICVGSHPKAAAYPLEVSVEWQKPGGASDSLEIATGWAQP